MDVIHGIHVNHVDDNDNDHTTTTATRVGPTRMNQRDYARTHHVCTFDENYRTVWTIHLCAHKPAIGCNSSGYDDDDDDDGDYVVFKWLLLGPEQPATIESCDFHSRLISARNEDDQLSARALCHITLEIRNMK